jgi:hypothetical protein
MTTENSGTDRLYYKVMSGSWRWIYYFSNLGYYDVDINENISVRITKESDGFIAITAAYRSGSTNACSIANSGAMDLNNYYDQEKCKKMYKLIKKAYKAWEKEDKIRRSNKFPDMPVDATYWSDFDNITLWSIL